jgi:phosphoglycerol transferase MdoB-like AlkP superfamily enzyme
LDVKKQWPASDVEVVDKSTGFYATKAPFVTYYMSISGHMEYSFTGNNMCYKNRHLVANEPYSDAIRAYIACQLEFEKSLELLMQRLEEAGTLQNTVFVITADHYPYGLSKEEYSELFGHKIEENFELYENGCIIYKPGMTPQVVDELCYSIDLLPTLSNLFGVEFDSRLYMGRDIFSDKAPLVVFNNRSWITDKGRYNTVTGEAIGNDGSPLDPDYVKRINSEVSNRFAVSARILDKDYWRILFE